ncbi:hypothetical protein [Oleiphilus messinensis]|nr:hypothetical protein [Oleiphilus messinensis]
MWAKFIIQKILILCFALSIVGCDNDHLEVIRADAHTFCEIHNPTNWKSYSENNSIEHLDQELSKRIESSLKTHEMKSVVAELSNIQFFKELYPAAKEKITALIQSEWNCEYYKMFYSITFTNEAYLPVTPAKDVSLEIRILDDHRLVLGNREALIAETNFRSVVGNITNTENLIVVTIETGVSESTVENILQELQSLKVANVRLVYL